VIEVFVLHESWAHNLLKVEVKLRLFSLYSIRGGSSLFIYMRKPISVVNSLLCLIHCSYFGGPSPKFQQVVNGKRVANASSSDFLGHCL
jgi:hypothetical protein